MKNNLPLKIVGKVSFPEFQGVNINMMPFIMGDASSIPEEYAAYLPLIAKCSVDKSEIGKVGYLSITESVTTKEESQRRPGIHTEASLAGSWGGGWGKLHGLFMASNVDRSCKLWDLEVEPTHRLGLLEAESLSLLNQAQEILLGKNELVWLTDKVPHESLTLPKGTSRQWFRLVTNEVHGWYADHSTENRLGVMPDCRIIKGDKFSMF